MLHHNSLPDMLILIASHILGIGLDLRLENPRHLFIFSDPPDRRNIRSDPEEQRTRLWQPSQCLSFHSKKHVIYREGFCPVCLEMVVRADVEQLGRYFKSVVEALDRRGGFKIREEPVHGFCDAGFVLWDVSCVDTV